VDKTFSLENSLGTMKVTESLMTIIVHGETKNTYKFCSVSVDKGINYLEYLDVNCRNISKYSFENSV
jgi:hypothetical protein